MILVNLGREPFQLRRGERIAQLVIAPSEQPVLKEVGVLEELGESDRGPVGSDTRGVDEGARRGPRGAERRFMRRAVEPIR